MLISEHYRTQQQQLHANPNYGTASLRYAPFIKDVIDRHDIRTLLDYGAGKGRLGEALFLAGFDGDYLPYDPAIPYWSDAPQPAEMVACIDVLEHIEPDSLDEVLADLRHLTRQVGVFTVHTGPAKKVLPDGRNAHLIQEPVAWWRGQLAQHFAIVSAETQGTGAVFVVEPLP